MPHSTAKADPRVAPGKAGGPSITSSLLEWYDRHRRALPWRALPGEAPDPYRVWLSEIMLQQTTVAAVKPYFARFLVRWPDVAALASASTDAVMREWAGLGYYARARNLQACAKVVTSEHDGRFPRTEAALRSLPGIGDYTAAAVAAIAFGEPAAVVDGNVERVIARLFAIETPLPAARPDIRRITATLVPADRPGDFAQATMDFGATLCTPKHPACAICPVRVHCGAYRSGCQLDLPRRAPKTMRPQRFGIAVLLSRRDGAILVRTRPASGLLGGMTELFGTDWRDTCPDLATLPGIAEAETVRCGVVDHVFTHFALRLDVYIGRTSREDAPDGWRWVSAADLDSEAWPNLMAKVLDLASASVSPDPDANRLELPGLAVALQEDGGAGSRSTERQRTDHRGQRGRPRNKGGR